MKSSACGSINRRDNSRAGRRENGISTITEDYVGAHLANYDSLISLAHFKGHAMAGYGGAIKNMSIGIGSSEGKCWIHSAGTSHTSPWGGNQDRFLESMGDATSAVINQLENILFFPICFPLINSRGARNVLFQLLYTKL